MEQETRQQPTGYKPLKVRKQRELAKALLRKWYMIDDVIAYYVSQLANTEKLIAETDGLLEKIEAPHRNALKGSLQERQQALTNIVQSLLRWKSAIDICEMNELTAVEDEVFVERYVKRKLWKWILCDYFDERHKLKVNDALINKVANAIVRADAEAKEKIDKTLDKSM